MSTNFQPMEIPPGVVAKPTKKMNSSSYAEVNLVRWVEGSFVPVGGQERYGYAAFASRCRKVHAWIDTLGVTHIAYLCEANVYVDTGGVITEITPTGGMIAPSPDPTLGGYGDGAYGSDPDPSDAYGTARHTGGAARAKTVPYWFSIDNWGQQLLVMTSVDGRLLYWDPTVISGAGLLLQAVPTSPTGRGFVVTPDRFVIMFGITSGGGSFRRWGWCDQENYSDWNFASTTNKAGFYDLEPASPFITACNGKHGVLFFTARKAYVARYTGLPYIYTQEELSEDCTPWSPASITNTSMQMFWMSEQGAWTFDGTQITPVQCLVRDWINDDIDVIKVRQQACCVHVGEYSEFWWFFPQEGQPYNTRCVIYNYREGWWSQGRMARSAGLSSDFDSFTIMANGTVAYKHESGFNYPDGTELPWAETFNINMGSGAGLTTFKQMMPDLDGDSTNIGFQLYYKNDRTDKTVEKITPVRMIRDGGYVDFRTTARDFRLRISSISASVTPYTLGQHLIDITPRGSR